MDINKKLEQRLRKIFRQDIVPCCPKCNDDRTVGFSWKYVDKEGKNALYHKAIFIDKPLKWGWLYKCSKCAQPWYLDGNERMMSIINEKELDLIEQWTVKKLTLPDHVFEKLKHIQAVSLSSPGNDVRHARVPCKVITSSEEIDFAYIYLQQGPPSTLLTDNIRLVDEIKDIVKSSYALPKEIRYAAYHASEISMGYSPTEIETPDERRFIIDSYREFFDWAGYKGEDMKLAKQLERINGQFVQFDTRITTSFFGDWDDNYKDLFIKNK